MNHSAPTTQGKSRSITTQEMTRVTLFTAMAIAAAVLARFGSNIVPFSLVPIVVFLAGGILGAQSGAYSMLAYMVLGLVGLPVFASPPYGGFTYILTPSFGFVPGFVVGAYVVGVVSRWARSKGVSLRSSDAALTSSNVSLTSFIVANVAGILAYNTVGIAYLSLVLNIYLDSPTSIARALQIGLVPFIVPDLIKAVIAAAIARAVVRAGTAR